MNMRDLLFPDNYAGDKQYMQQKGYGRPTPGGPFAFWLSDAREQDREASLGGAMGGIHQLMKYIIMMRGGLKHQNGGSPGMGQPQAPPQFSKGSYDFSQPDGGYNQSGAADFERMLKAIEAMRANPLSYGARLDNTGYGYGE